MIVEELEKRFGLEDNESTPLREKLAHCLPNIGARIERYYNDAMAGGPCSSLLQNTNKFSEPFFYSDIENYVTIAHYHQNSLNLKKVFVLRENLQ